MQITTPEQAEQFASNLVTELEEGFASYKDIGPCLHGVLTDPRLIEILNQALIETAVRNYVNKHGSEHGYKVALNTLKLFHLLESNCVQSDYISDFPDFELRKKHLLWALLVAGYIHDAGRFYDASVDHESEVSEAMEVCEEYLVKLRDSTQRERDFIPRIIKELCLCHDKKAEVSGKAEIALLKLADALDCERDRTYFKRRWQDKNGVVVESKKIKDIFRNDRLPQNYFGTNAVERVEVTWNEYENAIDVKFAITDWAASLPLWNIHRVLRICEGGIESVANLAKRIRLMVEPKGQQAILLHPESFVVTPDLRVKSAVYTLDIDNEGNGEVQVAMQAENVSRSIRKAIRYEFWGLKETTWETDVQVQMWDGDNKPLQIQYKGRGELAISHSWLAILNKDMLPGEMVTIQGHYRWKNLADINEDKFEYQAQLPTDNLRIKVIFPEAFPRDSEELLCDGKLTHIQDEEARVTLRSPLLAYTQVEANRLTLCSHCHDLSAGHTYCLEWKTTEKSQSN